jgi:Ca2+/H+ antiporter
MLSKLGLRRRYLMAFHAALANQLQRALECAPRLGAALATIGLTIPAALAVGLILGKRCISASTVSMSRFSHSRCS